MSSQLEQNIFLEQEQERRENENENERLILFSDGVIAFAITVAAIAIRIPSDIDKLLDPNVLTQILLRCSMYIIAFLIVAASWNDHHTIFHHIKKNNIILVILNFVYLVSIVVIPIGLFLMGSGSGLLMAFSSDNQGITSFLQDKQGEITADVIVGALLFVGSQFIAGLSLALTWWYASHQDRLFDRSLPAKFVRYTLVRLALHPVSFLLSLIVLIILALSNATVYVMLGGLGIIILFLFVRWIFLRIYRNHLNTTLGSTDIGRIQLFSDAVFGVAITIAIAQIEFPSLGSDVRLEDVKNAVESLSGYWPLLHTYLIGFVIVGISWLLHYHLFHFIRRHDPLLITLNFCFLLSVILMFIPIKLYADNWDKALLKPDLFFGLWQVMASFFLLAAWLYAKYKKPHASAPRLLKREADPTRVRQFNIIILCNLPIFVILTLATVFFTSFMSPRIYLGLYLLMLGSVWLFAHLWTMTHPQKITSQQLS
ncbi:TMEM175 family protein [Tengunoibacter tsumagoiensis]|uniref:DUF1211 domain-containing membrane protein n=1 Tax=Tengunoibacter tsumagoiensis TaxID=2014871 RepID=A0A401ZUJ0_9CHLR|nr:TMEM175 family protein [Tengunoibacter tsumagoiensis]GCE10543.1 hypothetical protein KTT_04020 [Tengunoibacter tsumagoiensis]